MSINWNNLREWNGSQDNGFEELICQLAASENLPEDSRFFRKGTPDAGVECFWRLPNDDEWAWQAKFFRNSPGSTQWNQINDSVTNAIIKHPNLTKYTVCLPINLPDARIGRQKSAMVKWGDYVKKWQQLTQKKKMSVSFEFWGESEIAQRLSEEKHRGRHWFWFNETCLSNSWFENHIKVAVANAGDRYTPEINVDLPIRRYFDALGRTPDFFARLTELYSKACIEFKNINIPPEPSSLNNKYKNLIDSSKKLFSSLEPWIKTEEKQIEWRIIKPISWDSIKSYADEVVEDIWECIEEIREIKENEKKDEKNDSRMGYDELNYKIYHLHQFYGAISNINDESLLDIGKLLDWPALLLTGAAGQGKTHLLCDIVKKDSKQNLPRILLHGGHFKNTEPWSQIITELGLNCTRDEFIGALEAAAQANKSRALIFIDALNEGEGIHLWQKYLLGMLETFASSLWIGICISVRSIYENLIIPSNINKVGIVRLEHNGFEELTNDAASIFFRYYNIEPSTLLQIPGIRNPLFLKILCQGLNNKGITRLPSGYQGITSIFQYFIEAVECKLSKPEYLDYRERNKIVLNAIKQFAIEMANRGEASLPLIDAQRITQALYDETNHSRSLLYQLESEGVIDIRPNSFYDNNQEYVFFAYQRLSDHLIAKELLNIHLHKKNPKTSFSKNKPIGKLFQEENWIRCNRGLVEAMAILIPEMTGKDLPYLLPRNIDSDAIRESFVRSILWRNVNSFSDDTFSYINDEVVRYRGTYENFLDSMIKLATIPNHPLNANRLHKNLIRSQMPDRDAWWSIFLHREWQDEKAVSKLVEWAWSDCDKSNFSDEVVRLASITLAWFFTSSNRFLRDRATKAMVRLCENRLNVLHQILEMFLDVDDPYVMERLYAVAYGCAMRTTNDEYLTELAQSIYQWVFESGEPYPHILLRDYARGVIELVLHKKCDVRVDVDLIRPPYKSKWPSINVPKSDDISVFVSNKNKSEDNYWSLSNLYNSILNPMEDFCHYVIGDLREWTSIRINEPDKPNLTEIFENFIESLTDRQKKAFDEFIKTNTFIDYYGKLSQKEKLELYEKVFTKNDLNGFSQISKHKFLSTLRKNSKKYEIYCRYIEDYIRTKKNPYFEDMFDVKFAKRWIMKKVINMGWTVERFGNFDENLNQYFRNGRSGHKAERIGKKYQWIALHELLARISDNYKMKVDKWSERDSIYKGPWDIGRRDIDPSNLLKESQSNKWWDPHYSVWWAPEKYELWDKPANEIEWLKNKNNIPSIINLIELTNPNDMSCWLTVDGYYHWTQAIPPGEKRFEKRNREINYSIHGYFVRKKDISILKKWAKNQSWVYRTMPHSVQSYEIFLGEFFWSPVFSSQDTDYYCRPGWTRNDDKKIPVEVLVANDGYLQEDSGFDCSIDDSISINLPCRFLVDGMKLNWNGKEGQWYNKKGDLVACDPSIKTRGPMALLFDRESLMEFLQKEGLTIFWTIYGEKRTIGDHHNMDEYKGHLEINGFYILENGIIKGQTKLNFKPPIE